MNNKGKYLAVAGFVLSLAVAVPAFAQTGTSASAGVGMGMRRGMMPGTPGVMGTVSAVNGTTLTVTGKTWGPKTAAGATATASITYTVDASNAQVFKDGATSTISNVATGDMVMVQGTVTGSNIAATVIRDGMNGFKGMSGKPGFDHGSTSTIPKVSPIQGNGQPVVGGSITAISGTTLTVTNASNVTYTIDASNAKIVKNGTSTAFSTLATGDNVVVQGTVSGTSITASSVIDQGASNTAGDTSAGSSVTGVHSGGGFFDMIGGFFKHLFGF